MSSLCVYSTGKSLKSKELRCLAVMALAAPPYSLNSGHRTST